MTPKEQEIAIKELEERVDRLRNIYEQYFLGFERLEPTVPRKDVDRRFALMRKEQIRNTALRFKLNVIVQKYNTYAMHWIRICRQIEEGTYKRHVRRAKARFGEVSTSPELSIDVDMADFDMDAETDVDGTPSDADAAIESARESRPPPSYGTLPSGRAFPADRAARPAALPPGSHPRVVVRRRDDVEPTLASPVAGELGAVLREARAKRAEEVPPASPSSAQTLPDGPAPSNARGAAPSATMLAAGVRPRIMRVPDSARTGPLGSTRIPVAPASAAAASSSGRLPVSAGSAPQTEPVAPGSTPTIGRPPIVITPPSSFQPPGTSGASGASGGRQAAAPSTGRSAPASAPSTGRSPVAPSTGRSPVAPAAASSPSVARPPASAGFPATSRQPAAPPASSPLPRQPASEPGVPSTARQPVATSAGPPPRTPIGPAGASGAPQIRPLGSGGRILVTPATGPGAPPQPPPPSSPALPNKPRPGFVEKDADPGAPPPLPPGSRPRLPLPLPGGRPIKKG